MKSRDASSGESGTSAAFCSGVSTRQTIPLDITACPPKTEPISTTVTIAPLRAASNAAHKPEMPAPTMTMSVRGELVGNASPRRLIRARAKEISARLAFMDRLPTREHRGEVTLDGLHRGVRAADEFPLIERVAQAFVAWGDVH